MAQSQKGTDDENDSCYGKQSIGWSCVSICLYNTLIVFLTPVPVYRGVRLRAGVQNTFLPVYSQAWVRHIQAKAIRFFHLFSLHIRLRSASRVEAFAQSVFAEA